MTKKAFKAFSKTVAADFGMDLSPAEQERCYQNLIKGRGVSLRDEDLYYKMKDYFLN